MRPRRRTGETELIRNEVEIAWAQNGDLNRLPEGLGRLLLEKQVSQTRETKTAGERKSTCS
jgi:hypothetical protein